MRSAVAVLRGTRHEGRAVVQQLAVRDLGEDRVVERAVCVEDGRVERVPERRRRALLEGREQLLVLGQAVLVRDADNDVVSVVVLAQEVAQRLAC